MSRLKETFEWKNKKVLVTGAGGFIGSHLVERLVRLKANVSTFVRYNSRNDKGMLELLNRDITDQINIIMGDLKDSHAVRNAVKGNQIIFHLGAIIAIPYSYIHPSDFFQANILGTANILNACLEYEIKKIVHTSTSETYGTARYVPIDENHPLQAQSPYSASKISADKIAESYYHSFDMPITIIRPFNTYGPRQSSRAIIPTIITQALTKKNVELGSLYPLRDLTYVADIVNAFIKIAEVPKSIGEVINVGSGKEISIGELAEKIISIIGKKVKVNFDRMRVRPKNSEVNELIADNKKAKKILEWKPKISLDRGLRLTINWISENINRYKVGEYVI